MKKQPTLDDAEAEHLVQALAEGGALSGAGPPPVDAVAELVRWAASVRAQHGVLALVLRGEVLPCIGAQGWGFARRSEAEQAAAADTAEVLAAVVGWLQALGGDGPGEAGSRGAGLP